MSFNTVRFGEANDDIPLGVTYSFGPGFEFACSIQKIRYKCKDPAGQDHSLVYDESDDTSITAFCEVFELVNADNSLKVFRTDLTATTADQ